MSEKLIKSRIVHKHDAATNWSKAATFIPKQGEIIVYDKDSDYNYERIKIGDGATLVDALPFADDAVRTALMTAIDDVDDKVDAVSTLVGDTSVSEQIENAQIVYVGPTQPSDPNIKVWINTSEEGTGIVPILPRVATITLPKASWAGSASPYYQSVNVNTVTASTKIDLQPTVTQITALQNADIALMAENTNGAVKVYAFGGKPSADMTMQALLTEVSYV